MKQFIRLLFGRLTLITAAILLQVALLSYFILAFQNPYTYIAFYILGILVTLHILTKNTMPDNKIPWIILVLAAPTFGAIAYFMFSSNVISNRQKRLFRKINTEIEKYLRKNNFEKAFPIELKEYLGQSKYLNSACGKPASINTATKYYASGTDFFKDLIIELKAAEKFIFIEYFIIQLGDMWSQILEILKQKVSEGVEVRVIYDDIGCISKLPIFYCRKLKKMGIKCVKFNRFLPIVSAVHNNRDHRKITVIDGKTGFTGGINLADEYINNKKRFGYWKDSAIKLKGESVKNLTLMFLQVYCVQKKKMEDFSPYILENYESFHGTGITQVFDDGPKPIYNDYVGLNAYLNIINQARDYLYITTPYIVIDHALKNALIAAAKRGVDVRIITPSKADKRTIFYITKSNYKPLINAGIEIYEYSPGFMHAKNILSDDNVGIVGTINLDYRSLVHHYECGVWMCKAQALKELKEDFLETFKKCRIIDKKSANLNILQRLLCSLLSAFTPLL